MPYVAKKPKKPPLVRVFGSKKKRKGGKAKKMPVTTAAAMPAATSTAFLNGEEAYFELPLEDRLVVSGQKQFHRTKPQQQQPLRNIMRNQNQSVSTSNKDEFHYYFCISAFR
jgi:hypothetical protein